MAALENRGRAERRTRDASAVSCAWWKKHTSSLTTKAPEASGVPHAMVLTACFALSPVTVRWLSPSLRLRMCPSPVGGGSPGQLDATSGASGPRALGRPRSAVVSALSTGHAAHLKTRRRPPASNAPDAAASTASRLAFV